ncbi:MAG: aminomethyl-transferring glycine dehydrogenase subunit GcvPA [Peptostreptococcaceae bacterium]|nr:aminomethyl-transferring glycine dehydrogenase subunit GcvPA [Peptostreptococcaceae bacterium]
MSEEKKRIHPYIPNSVPEIKQAMMDRLGISNVEELYSYIPDELRFQGKLDLPEPFLSEIELKRHMGKILGKNISVREKISFLGAGCYHHFVPAVCDEINARSEFLTAYCGDTYSDHGKVQAIFEYMSLIGELVEMDVVGLATYDGGQAVSTSLMMSHRVTGRKKLLLPRTMNPDIKNQALQFCSELEISFVACDPQTGEMDLADLRSKIDEDTCGVFLENPSYLGFIESRGEEISTIAHEKGALFIVSTDPSSLGVMEAPANYGADISCGDIQCLGIHMGFGSGLAGFIAAHDKPEFIMNFPNHFYGMYQNEKGEMGFRRSLNQRTSYGSRENAVEYLGTNAGLWAITSAVYLSLMGPEGMRELGENILAKSQYLIRKLKEEADVRPKFPDAVHFKEIPFDFSSSGLRISEINRQLYEKGFFGGKDLSEDMPELKDCALYCVTEMTTKEEIDLLAAALQEILQKKGRDEQ